MVHNGIGGGLPAAMRFRQMASVAHKLEVRRSDIQGLGVFAKQRIEPEVMLLEYKGEIIRQSVADIREERYRKAGAGDYMFSLADGTVVDATVRGSPARFVNHSCEPNCETKIVTVAGKKHIVIVSKTDILPGEELSYDYKFPIEDAGSKVKCNCGAARCSGTMN
jgi:SET domain-containing protein